MAMSIARPIKAGKIGPKTAGNQRKAGQPRPSNKRPSNKNPGQPKPNCKSPSNSRISSLTAATRLGSAVTSGPEVITGLGDTAEVGAVALDTEVAVAGSGMKREKIAS